MQAFTDEYDRQNLGENTQKGWELLTKKAMGEGAIVGRGVAIIVANLAITRTIVGKKGAGRQAKSQIG